MVHRLAKELESATKRGVTWEMHELQQVLVQNRVSLDIILASYAVLGDDCCAYILIFKLDLLGWCLL